MRRIKRVPHEETDVLRQRYRLGALFTWERNHTRTKADFDLMRQVTVRFRVRVSRVTVRVRVRLSF